MDRLLSFYSRRLLKSNSEWQAKVCLYLGKAVPNTGQSGNTRYLYWSNDPPCRTISYILQSSVFLLQCKIGVLEMGDMGEQSVGSVTFRDGADQGTVDLLRNQS